jgi:cytidylate kinase
MTCKVALMWDCYGLESAVRIDDFEKQRMLAILKGEDPNKIAVPLSLTLWQLRAQANMQRYYEIYIIETTDDVSTQDIVDAFERAPQAMADRVREIGHKIYGHRVARDEKVLIR